MKRETFTTTASSEWNLEPTVSRIRAFELLKQLHNFLAGEISQSARVKSIILDHVSRHRLQ